MCRSSRGDDGDNRTALETSHYIRPSRLRPHKDAPWGEVPPEPPCGEGFTRQGGAKRRRSGLSAKPLPRGTAKGRGRSAFSRARFSPAQRAARATCGAWCNRVAAAIRFLGAWVRVGKKKSGIVSRSTKRQPKISIPTRKNNISRERHTARK